MPLNSKDGIILLDHGAKLVGKFKVVPLGDFFTVTPQKFSARLFTREHQNPPTQDFYVSTLEFNEDEKRPERTSLRIMNAFAHGLSLILTRDQRIIIQNLYQGELGPGTILYLGKNEYRKYVGEIKNFTFDGLGTLEFANGLTLQGRFGQGTLNGPYLDRGNQNILQYARGKLVSSTPMQKQTCHDPYLGDYHLNQGSCKDGELQAHSANFKKNLLVYHGNFRSGKLWRGEISPMALDTEGTFGKFENGIPSGVMRIQKKNGMTLGALIEGKLSGQITSYDFTTGERFIGQYEHGKRNGPFRLLNYNNEIVQKGQYKNDVLDGTIFTYDQKVRLKSTENYQRGKKTF